MDHYSLRAASIAKELSARGWRIILINLVHKKERDFEKNLSKSKDANIYYAHNCYSVTEAIKTYKAYLGVPIHLFSRSSSSLILNFLRTYPRLSIYDPVEITYGAIRFPNIRDFFENSLRYKLRANLGAIIQKLTLKHASNIICRDMQLSNPKVMLRKIRKTKNILLFSDYTTFNNKEEKYRKNSQRKKLVCCGNLNVFDYKRSKASYIIFEKFLNNGHEVHIYVNFLYKNRLEEFYRDHPNIRRLEEKYSLLKVHDTLTTEQLNSELKSCDYGVFLPGDHFFNKYGKSNFFWKPNYVFLSSGARITSYIEAKLITIGVSTKPQNYPFFLAKRYGKVLSINHKELEKIDNLSNKDVCWEKKHNQKFFQLTNNIKRLENFYEKIQS